jgi:hypothetical protein
MESKKEELKAWLKKLNLTQKYFAGLYCEQTYCEPSEEFVIQFYEKFKKQVSKNSKDEKIIDTYLNFLFELEEFKNGGYAKPNFYCEDFFTKSFNEKMKGISKNITDKLKNKCVNTE